MDLVEEIRKWFSNGLRNTAYIIESVGTDYPAYVLREDTSYGVAIPFENRKVFEEFAHAYLTCEFRNIAGKTGYYLLLTSDLENIRNEFATICASFVEPGKEGEKREEILRDPSEWWNTWRSFIGNKMSDKQPYSIIAEMLVYEKLLVEGNVVDWLNTSYSTHDIQGKLADYEVKATLSRYGKQIQINGEHQLETSGKPLYLCFIRFEKDENGISVDDIVERLVSRGVSHSKINKKLEDQGYHPGASVRRRKYKILESCMYEVDDNFPAIRKDKFKDNQFPIGVVHLSYQIDISHLEYSDMNLA